jgi:tetratricopeptide (TPR) repeat protein
MSDPLRTDGSQAHGDAPDIAERVARDAKIEQLLLVGLDHYFAAHYEQAINVWTRALFLDRNHARARAYIDRARSALAERHRESEEMVRNGVAAFDRGDSNEARRLLHAAIDRGAPSDEALAVLERLNRLEAVAAPAPSSVDPMRPRATPRAGQGSAKSIRSALMPSAAALAVVVLVGWAASTSRIDWRSLVAFAQSGGRADAPAARAAPVTRQTPLPLPRRGEEALSRARALAASGHLRDALAALDAVRSTDAERADADRLRGDIQRQLLALTTLPTVPPPARGNTERRNP